MNKTTMTSWIVALALLISTNVLFVLADQAPAQNRSQESASDKTVQAGPPPGAVADVPASQVETKPKSQGSRAEDLIDEAIGEVRALVVQSKKGAVSRSSSPLSVSGLLPKASTEPMDIDFDKAPLEDVFKTLATSMNCNIVLDPAVSGHTVDLHLKNTTGEEVMELLNNAYGLGVSTIGNIMFVSTQEKIRSGQHKFKVMELQNITFDDAKTAIGNLVGSVTVSKESNALVLGGSPEELQRAEKVLASLDVAQPQVLLEAKIIEINDSALKDLGVSWPEQITSTFQEVKRPLALPDPAAKLGGPLQMYALARSAVQFNATIKMLESKSKAKVLSNPKITTMNNKEAEIFVGDKYPYTVTTIANGVSTSEVRFVEPGIRLSITPSIVEDDFVVIKVQPEVSFIFSFIGPNNDYPWIKTRQATAYVRVKNGEAFILGGLLSSEDKKDIYGVPFLSKIPGVGHLFSYEHKTSDTTDLVIMVQPTIVSGKASQEKGE